MKSKEETDFAPRVQISLYGTDKRIEKLRGKVEYDQNGELVYKIKDETNQSETI